MHAKRYVRHLHSRLGFDLPKTRHFRYTLRNLIDIHGLSLRSVERTVVNLGLYENTKHCSSTPELTHFAAALCVMRNASRDLYQRAAAGELTFRQAEGFLRLSEWRTPPDDDGTFCRAIEAFLVVALADTVND